jgi:hypothetical protein
MLPRCFDPLHKVVRHYRLQGQNDVAYLFAQSGLRFDRSYQSNLWNYPPLEDYQLDEEISIVAYYTRFQKEGLAAANRFMLRKGVPHWSRDQNRINLFWYPILLQGASFQPIHSSSHRFINGSIVKTETGYDLLCTAVNYFPIDQYIVHTDDPDGVLRSQLYLLSLDHHDQVMGEYLIQETLPREKIPSCNREGLEEGRFVIGYGNPNERWLTAVASDTHPEGSLQVCLAKLSSDNRSIETLLPLFGQKPERHEKNWLPFMDKDTLRFIYAYDPFVVATPDLTTGICRFDALYDYPWDLSLWKGAAAPIAFDDGYLMLVYETVMQPDCSLSYLHRFVFLDSTFRIKRISYPFIFLHKGMERSLGMSIDHSQTELIIPVGIGYKDLYLCRLPLEQVRSFLEQGTPD